MLCVFRCDANQQIGLGHFSRCLSLANALFRYNVECVFIMQNPDKSIQNTIQTNHHKILTLPNSKTIFNEIDDKKQSRILIDNHCLSPDLLIIDHYQLSPIWWHGFRNSKCQLFILNDTNNIINDVDYVWQMSPIQNNSTANTTTHLPVIFSGPKYVLLKKEFQQKFTKKELKTKHILISIGATDPENTSEFFIKNISQLLPDVTITLMTTSLNSHLAVLKENFTSVNIRFCIDSSNIAEVMQQHDMIITAAGTMMWEGFSLGILTLIIKNHPLQQTNVELITPTLSELYLGEEKKLVVDPIIKVIRCLLNNKNKYIDIQVKMQKLCDGKGCERVAQKLMEIDNNA